MYGRRKGGIEKTVRKWGVFMSAILKQKLIDIANGFTKYGLWKGGGSSALSEMTDVTLTDLQTNDVLTYNGSEWVNDDNLQTQINTLNSNLNDRTIQVYKYSSANPGIQKGNTYQYAPIRLNCLNANDGERVGIGFENAGVNAGFLYLAADGNLYFMDHLGVDHKISMS